MKLTSSIHRLFPILAALSALFQVSCQATHIPLNDSLSGQDTELTVVENEEYFEIDLNGGYRMGDGAVYSVSITQPGEDIRLVLSGVDVDASGGRSDQIIESEHSFSAPIGIEKGQGILELILEDVPDMYVNTIRIEKPFSATAGDEGDVLEDALAIEDILSVNTYAQSPGLVLDDFRIALPERYRYRQEVRSPGTASPDEQPALAVYQDVYLDRILDGFDYYNSIPVFEITYEYTEPDEGMPVQLSDAYLDGETNFPTPDMPVARLDLLPETMALQDSRSFELRLRPGLRTVFIYPEMLSELPDLLRFSHDSVYGRLRNFRLLTLPRNPGADEVPTALPIDLGQLLEYSPALWRQSDYELFRWSMFPSVLIIDFADYDIQAQFLRRLAFFVEKEGYRGSLVSDARLANLHGWNAHNYHPRDLAEFFNRADTEGLQLNPGELEFRDLLLEQGLLLMENGRYAEGEGSVISVTSHPLQSRASRLLFLNHEALHGVFYNIPELRELSEEIWTSLDEDSRSYLKYYFSYVGYDPEDEYLMINEFQAYMLQQDIVNIRWMVQTRMAERIVRRFPGLNSFIYGMNVDMGWRMLEAAESLQSLVYQKEGIIAGDLLDLVDWPEELQ